MSVRAWVARLGSIDGWSRIFALLSGAAVLVLGVHIILDVLSRNVRGEPLNGTIEYVQFWWMPCIAFLAMAHTQAREENLRVTILRDRLASKLRRRVDVVALGLAVVAIAVLMVFGWVDAVYSFEIRQAALGTAVVPIWPLKFVAVLGLFVFLLQTLVMLGRRLRRAAGDGELGDHASPNVGGL